MSISVDWFEETIKETPESKSVDLDGIRIHYLVWGDTSKP
ncbi:MAG TPA: alpha/beta hydrolase, partial [Gammaproteobacteria bacterium]|nr:alpha/beta hydrolase [Gammaproteobacteria bacterium]